MKFMLHLALALLGPPPGSLDSEPTVRYAPGDSREKGVGGFSLVHMFIAVLLDEHTTVLIHSPVDGHLGFPSY